MVYLAGQQGLPLLGDLSIGDVHRHAADPRDPAGAVDAGRRRPDAPANLPVGTLDPEFVLRWISVLEKKVQAALQPLPVFRMDQGANVFGGDAEMLPVDAEDAVLPVIPKALAGGAIPVP